MNINFQSRFCAQWNHVCRFQPRFQSRFHSLTHLFCTSMYVRSTAMRPRNNDRANAGGGGGGECRRRRWSVMVKSVQQVVVVVVRRLNVAHLMCQRRLPLIIIIHDDARRLASVLRRTVHARSLVVDHDLRQTLATLKTFSQSIKLQKPSLEVAPTTLRLVFIYLQFQYTSAFHPRCRIRFFQFTFLLFNQTRNVSFHFHDLERWPLTLTKQFYMSTIHRMKPK